MKTQLQRTTKSQEFNRARFLRDLWAELHRSPPPIAHPIPKLNPPPCRNSVIESLERRLQVANRALTARSARFRPALCATFLLLPVLLLAGCTVVTYTNPSGERFSRAAFGANTSMAELGLDAGTNGLRKLELRGYRNDGSQALSAAIEAALRAARSACHESCRPPLAARSSASGRSMKKVPSLKRR